MSGGIFITSTGTDIGKTFACSALLFQMVRANIAATAIKPVVSGFIQGDANSDPARLLRAMGRPYHPSAVEEICPWRFEAPIAANLAAAKEGKQIHWPELVRFCQGQISQPQITLIEGAGGVMSPITDSKLVVDLMQELATPAILVVGNYLGSISHTLTAMETLKSYGVKLLGLIVCESVEPALQQQQFKQMIFNRHQSALPLVWIPRNSTKPDAFKFSPSLEPLWINYQNL